MKAVLLILMLSLTGCAEWYKVWEDDGWTKVMVETEDSRKICSAFLLKWVDGCAVRFDAWKRCVMIVPPRDETMIEHEKKHCAGFSHSK